MGALKGTVALTNLPPHRGLIVSVSFYRVAAGNAPAPHNGDPPANAANDCQEVANQVDLQTELTTTMYELPFAVTRPDGFYYLQVRAILFRTQGSKFLAQSEQFFFARRPLQLTERPAGHITLPVSWPTTTLAELHDYGTIRPRHAGDA